MRGLVRLLVLATALVPLGGCGISLFSDRETVLDEERLVQLEQRVDALERNARDTQ